MSTDTSSDPNRPAPDLEHGLPMVSANDPEALAREKARLTELAGKPFYVRWMGYARLTGPGWLQSAMTLGSGSAAGSLALGAFFGYELLWIQPVAMILGIIMLSAMSHQTLSTEARPFGAVNKFFSPAVGWAWALATLISTIIWHFPQYALGAGMVEDMTKAATGTEKFAEGTSTLILLAAGLGILVVSTLIVWNYGSGRRGIRLYERALKLMVWLILIAFAVVVGVSTINGRIDWLAVAKGYIPFYHGLPDEPAAVERMMGAFGAAVGINMTFLFPYTLLARGWGKEHRGLARYDLITGMLIPFVLATGLISIATAAIIYHGDVDVGDKLGTEQTARILAETPFMGRVIGRYIFGLGILGMALSSITTHMLVTGFAACEIFDIEPKGWKYKLACLIPAPGVLGVLFWTQMKYGVAVWTSAICGLLLPIAYIAFMVMMNRPDYLKEDMPRGAKRWAWNLGMAAAILAVCASVGYFLYTSHGKLWEPVSKLFGAE